MALVSVLLLRYQVPDVLHDVRAVYTAKPNSSFHVLRDLIAGYGAEPLYLILVRSSCPELHECNMALVSVLLLRYQVPDVLHHVRAA